MCEFTKHYVKIAGIFVPLKSGNNDESWMNDSDTQISFSLVCIECYKNNTTQTIFSLHGYTQSQDHSFQTKLPCFNLWEYLDAAQLEL